MSTFKAVIFDIGGVVLQSPFIAIAEYEREHDLPKDYINVSITSYGASGAWQKFERGELGLFEFYEQFGRNLSDTARNNAWYKQYCIRKNRGPVLPDRVVIDGRELFGRMMRISAVYDLHFLKAIRRIRQSGKYQVIALTNNFAAVDMPASEREFLGWGKEGPIPGHLRELFDDFCDSSSLGMRKPDAEFYLLACQRNKINPPEAVFVDDIPENVKAGQALGMHAIRVLLGKTLEGVKELEKVLDMDLTSDLPIGNCKL